MVAREGYEVVMCAVGFVDAWSVEARRVSLWNVRNVLSGIIRCYDPRLLGKSSCKYVGFRSRNKHKCRVTRDEGLRCELLRG